MSYGSSCAGLMIITAAFLLNAYAFVNLWLWKMARGVQRVSVPGGGEQQLRNFAKEHTVGSGIGQALDGHKIMRRVSAIFLG